MTENNCKENCDKCITYFTPVGNKVYKCKEEDNSEIYLISYLIAVCVISIALVLVLFLIRRKNKRLINAYSDKEERIKSKIISKDSKKLQGYIKRKMSRLNINNFNSSKNNKTILTSAKKSEGIYKNLDSNSEAKDNFIIIKKRDLPMISKEGIL